MKNKFDTLAKQFKEEVCNRGEEIDPAYKMCWHTLTVGWALGKGLDPDSAKSFSTYIEYQTNLE